MSAYVAQSLDEAQNWLDEGFYVSHLRYHGTCLALEQLLDHDFSQWENSSRSDIARRPGDQYLVAHFHYLDGYRPAPFEPYAATIDAEYARAHTSLCTLIRPSDEFLERNKDVFPLAARVPGEMRMH